MSLHLMLKRYLGYRLSAKVKQLNKLLFGPEPSGAVVRIFSTTHSHRLYGAVRRFTLAPRWLPHPRTVYRTPGP